MMIRGVTWANKNQNKILSEITFITKGEDNNKLTDTNSFKKSKPKKNQEKKYTT
jgi:hypothetical protein